MRLIKLGIENFRAISSNVEISFESENSQVNDMLILVGANNSGKSSILWAYDYFIKGNTPNSEDFHGAKGEPIKIEATLRVETDEDRKAQEIQTFFNPENDILKVRKIWETSLPSKNSFKLEWWDSAKDDWQICPEKMKPKLNSRIVASMPTPIWIEGLTTPESVIDSLQALVKQTVLDKLKQTEEYKSVEDALAKFQKLVEVHQYTKEVEDHINETLGLVFPSISLQIQNEGGNIDFIKALQDSLF